MKKETLEDPCLAIRSILYVYSNVDNDEIKPWMRQDISSKLELISDKKTKFDMALSVIHPVLPPEYKNISSIINMSDEIMSEKTKFDVLIVAVIDNEYDMVKRVFGLPDKPELFIESKGHWFHKSEIKNEMTGESLSCLFTMVGDAKNIKMATFLSPILNTYNFDLAVLVGIAAGPKKKVNFGDVIIPPQVLYYESVKLDDGMERIRSHPFILDPRLEKISVGFVSAHKEMFHSAVSSAFDDFALGECKYIKELSLKRSVLLSGEKLLSDKEKIDELIFDHHDQARAVEMEGAGFASVCESEGVPWIIFRGISDFGDKDKKKLKGFQKHAALSATIACKLFLENSYIPSDESHF